MSRVAKSVEAESRRMSTAKVGGEGGVMRVKECGNENVLGVGRVMVAPPWEYPKPLNLYFRRANFIVCGLCLKRQISEENTHHCLVLSL